MVGSRLSRSASPQHRLSAGRHRARAAVVVAVVVTARHRRQRNGDTKKEQHHQLFESSGHVILALATTHRITLDFCREQIGTVPGWFFARGADGFFSRLSADFLPAETDLRV